MSLEVELVSRESVMANKKKRVKEKSREEGLNIIGLVCETGASL